MKYYFKLQDGSEFEIDELDYNNLCGRIATGRSQGYYKVRGSINTDTQFAFQYFMIVRKEGKEPPKDKTVRNIDIDKRKPTPVGKLPVVPKGCPHDFNKAEDFEYVVKNFDGKLQYRKRCLECGKTSSLIKPLEVENAMKAIDKTLADVLDVSSTS